jgi:hypothetical protein
VLESFLQGSGRKLVYAKARLVGVYQWLNDAGSPMVHIGKKARSGVTKSIFTIQA